MFLKKKESLDIEKFWQDYETSINEKVLARSLGRYVSGWAKFGYPLWGLAIATSGGFRFHHFPYEGWLMAISRVSSGREPPKEKYFFIPKETIKSIELVIEKRWWKRILSSAQPMLAVQCFADNAETTVLIETDRSADAIVDALKPAASAEGSC